MTGGQERGLWLDTAHHADLATFVERAQRLGDAAVIRLRQRSDGLLAAWTATGFDVLASRVVRGRVRPADVSAAADALLRGLAAIDAAGRADPGFPMDSAWRGALPPESGFVHLDDVPARVVLDLAQRGVELSKEHGAQGPPVSLLDQEVLRVEGLRMRYSTALAWSEQGAHTRAMSTFLDFAAEWLIDYGASTRAETTITASAPAIT